MKLVLVRHGQSQWNLENRFTGWVDVDLTEQGVKEAREAGERLSKYKFDAAFTSGLMRAQKTLDLILEVTGQTDIPVTKNSALNERDYGDLAGLNKAETAEKHGADQVHIWRRSYDVKPPNGESLKDTYERVIPYFQENIQPELKSGKTVLVVAHGNSLRSLIMYIEGLSSEEILKRELGTGQPIEYEFDENLNLIS